MTKQTDSKMIIPIRCFTCSKVIAHKWNAYAEAVKSEDPKSVLDDLGVHRDCCRRMFLTHVNLIDVLLLYPSEKMDSGGEIEFDSWMNE